ncbi:PREDICTED: apolipoprotein L5 [Propithecus coquereli]|uniref:apolipoprotein L5 n=1 Tax=Propithecus coquereli TaxID=379532 RepID=UPI00063F3FC2|nr:PREDICTED: apolipoprotein L5 [Propithecus coquereli]
MLLASLVNLCQSWQTNHLIRIVYSDEASMLYHILFEELLRRESESMPFGNLSEEEKRFLSYFPLKKYQLEKNIQELNTIADQVDRTHKTLTKANLVASSSGAVSGVMSILGFALAPVTVGGSLILSAAGVGLGAAAAITKVLTNALENRSNSAARDKASRLVTARMTSEHEAFGGIKLPEVEATGQCVAKCISIIKSLRAHQMAKANFGFMSMVKNCVATHNISFWKPREVQTIFVGTSLAVTKGAQVTGAAGAGLLLMQDVSKLLQNWKHLEEGARAETAKELRTLAKEQEQELRQLTERYQDLQQKASETPSQGPEQGSPRSPPPLPVMEQQLRPGPGGALRTPAERTASAPVALRA